MKQTYGFGELEVDMNLNKKKNFGQRQLRDFNLTLLFDMLEQKVKPISLSTLLIQSTKPDGKKITN